MRFGVGMAVLAIVGSAVGGPAFAAVCMDKSMTQDEIIAAISAALAQPAQFGVGFVISQEAT